VPALRKRRRPRKRQRRSSLKLNRLFLVR
jgi:hypothetical protein